MWQLHESTHLVGIQWDLHTGDVVRDVMSRDDAKFAAPSTAQNGSLSGSVV